MLAQTAPLPDLVASHAALGIGAGLVVAGIGAAAVAAAQRAPRALVVLALVAAAGLAAMGASFRLAEGARDAWGRRAARSVETNWELTWAGEPTVSGQRPETLVAAGTARVMGRRTDCRVDTDDDGHLDLACEGGTPPRR